MPSKPVPEWFLLNGVEVGTRAKHILGAVVPGNKPAPYQEYRPNLDDLPASERLAIEALSADIWENDNGAVPITDYIATQKKVSENSAGISVYDLLHTFARRRVGQEVEIVAGHTKRYTIDNPGAKITDRYIPCEAWFEEVKKLCNDKRRRQLFFVTGVQVCWELKVRYDKARDIEVDMKAGVPNAAAQNPVPGKTVALEGKHIAQKMEKVEQTFPEKVVLAVRYHEITPEYAPSNRRWSIPFFTSETPKDVRGFSVKAVVRGNHSNYAARSAAAGSDFYILPALYVDAETEEAALAEANGRLSHA